MADANARTDRHSPPAGPAEWRLRYRVGDLVHYTEWTVDFAVVENRYDQYRRADAPSEVTLERREVLRG